ncbi:unnamed protein product [Symbiodinium natans]|uniref:Uncharacterized protein n=1 Tax=Symbiodinium natans TaxID=878477 RepID=A0A812SR46_9DINO|nr:unnamed protein product [Symbiodinium natans]
MTGTQVESTLSPLACCRLAAEDIKKGMQTQLRPAGSDSQGCRGENTFLANLRSIRAAGGGMLSAHRRRQCILCTHSFALFVRDATDSQALAACCRLPFVASSTLSKLTLDISPAPTSFFLANVGVT